MKTRLNQHSRSLMKRLAEELVSLPALEKALDTAYAAAAKDIRALNDKRYPPDDMAVLKKYDVARTDGCIYLTGEGMNHDSFIFREGDEPLRPEYKGCVPIMATAKTAKLFLAWVAAKDALEEGLKVKRADYYALIDTSRNFEDVESVWPEIASIRDKCGLNAIAVIVDDDVVARIKADVAARQKEAA